MARTASSDSGAMMIPPSLSAVHVSLKSCISPLSLNSPVRAPPLRPPGVPAAACRPSLEQLGHLIEKAAAGSELRGAHPDARPVADLVRLVEKIDDAEAAFEAAQRRNLEALHRREVDLNVGGQVIGIGKA